MKFTFKTLNNTTVELEALTEKEAIQKLSFWQSLPTKCGICREDVHFEYRNIDDNSYYTIICHGTPKHQLSLGQYKKGDGLFIKPEWKDAYSNHPQNESRKEILIGEICQIAKEKGVEQKSIALGMSGNSTNNIDNLTIEQLEKALEFIKKK